MNFAQNLHVWLSVFFFFCMFHPQQHSVWEFRWKKAILIYECTFLLALENMRTLERETSLTCSGKSWYLFQHKHLYLSTNALEPPTASASKIAAIHWEIFSKSNILPKRFSEDFSCRYVWFIPRLVTKSPKTHYEEFVEWICWLVARVAR